jgi:hypothetical protein
VSWSDVVLFLFELSMTVVDSSGSDGFCSSSFWSFLERLLGVTPFSGSGSDSLKVDLVRLLDPTMIIGDARLMDAEDFRVSLG